MGSGRLSLKAAGRVGFFMLEEGVCYLSPRWDHGLRKELNLSADTEGTGGMDLPNETPMGAQEIWEVRQQKVPKIACWLSLNSISNCCRWELCSHQSTDLTDGSLLVLRAFVHF